MHKSNKTKPTKNKSATASVKYDSRIFNAAIQDNDVLIKALLENKANINEREPKATQTPLHYAATTNSVKAIKALLEGKAEVNAKTSNQNMHSTYTRGTALHLAAMGLNIEIMQLLIAAGANVNAQDELRDIPLHIVIHRSSNNSGVKAAQILLDAKADPTIKGQHGRTSAQLAHEEDAEMISALLQPPKKTQGKKVPNVSTSIENKKDVQQHADTHDSSKIKKKKHKKKKKTAGSTSTDSVPTNETNNRVRIRDTFSKVTVEALTRSSILLNKSSQKKPEKQQPQVSVSLVSNESPAAKI